MGSDAGRPVTSATRLLDLAQRVRSARARAGMTRRQLAQASGTSERYLANIEGGVGNPSLETLGGLSSALGVALAELLPLGGERDEARSHAAALLRRMPDGRVAEAVAWINSPAAASISRGRRIALTGLRGAGKSTLGTSLAERLQFPFVEMSKQMEREYGGKIGLLIELGGQAAFRHYAREAWERILGENDAAVIATPGGIVADAALFGRILETAHTVWLTATPEDHMMRVMAQGDFRPMSDTNAAMDDLRAIMQARAPDYARAQGTLDTSRAGFGATLSELESLSRRLTAYSACPSENAI